MTKRILASAALLAAFTWTPARAQTAASVIAAASNAMGVQNLKTIQYSASGSDFALGQSAVPGGPWPKFTVSSYTRSVNFETPASQADRVRNQFLNPPSGGGAQPIPKDQKQSQTIVVGASTPWVQQLEIWMLPQGFLRAAATRSATLESKTIDGKKYSVVSFMGDNKAKVNGYINAQNQVERVETWIDHPVVGDMSFEAIYSDWKDVGGAPFPMHIVQKQGGFPILDLNVGEAKANAPVTIQAAQGGGGGGGGGGNAGQTSEKLGEGVYLMTGGYAVVAVEMKDGIVFLEPSNSEASAQAKIAEAKRLWPGKPIKMVVNTHTHFDHSSGLRAFVAEGATILTYEKNKDYLQQVLSLPHTLNPDAQQKAAKPIKIETMSETKTLTDGEKVIELHHWTDFGHHPGMLLAWLPKEKVLFEADGYNPQAANAPPPNPASPYNLSLLAQIERLKLEPVRIIPVHYPQDGRVITLAELKRVTGKT